MNHETLQATAQKSSNSFRALIEGKAHEILEAMQQNSDAGARDFRITHTLVLDLNNGTMEDAIRFSVATVAKTGAEMIPDPSQPELWEDNCETEN